MLLTHSILISIEFSKEPKFIMPNGKIKSIDDTLHRRVFLSFPAFISSDIALILFHGIQHVFVTIFYHDF
jgi:hypothetical protein